MTRRLVLGGVIRDDLQFDCRVVEVSCVVGVEGSERVVTARDLVPSYVPENERRRAMSRALTEAFQRCADA